MPGAIAGCPSNPFSGVHVRSTKGEYCRLCLTSMKAPKAPRNPRSTEAYLSLDHAALSERERQIVGLISEAQRGGRYGLTTWELEQALGGLHQSISATVSRLYHDRHVIRPSGHMRKTETGRRADVYEVGDPTAKDAPKQPKVAAPEKPKACDHAWGGWRYAGDEGEHAGTDWRQCFICGVHEYRPNAERAALARNALVRARYGRGDTFQRDGEAGSEGAPAHGDESRQGGDVHPENDGGV